MTDLNGTINTEFGNPSLEVKRALSQVNETFAQNIFEDGNRRIASHCPRSSPFHFGGGYFVQGAQAEGGPEMGGTRSENYL